MTICLCLCSSVKNYSLQLRFENKIACLFSIFILIFFKISLFVNQAALPGSPYLCRCQAVESYICQSKPFEECLDVLRIKSKLLKQGLCDLAPPSPHCLCSSPAPSSLLIPTRLPSQGFSHVQLPTPHLTPTPARHLLKHQVAAEMRDSRVQRLKTLAPALCGFESQLCHLVALSPWAEYLILFISVSSSVKQLPPTSRGCYENYLNKLT